MPEVAGARRAEAPISGAVFEIQRFSIHDGPGIRTTVFMKGCPLRCVWCHNPEAVSSDPQLSFLADKCIGCGSCLEACTRGGHRLEEGRHILDRDRCVVCGACAAQCYARALEIVGHRMTVEEVVAVVLRDRPFYETSGGGITLSGGEPTFQIDFSEAVLQACKGHGLDTCIETCGQCESERLVRLQPYVDLFLFDFKETDPERHEAFTGESNARILANLRALYNDGARLRIRCPIIPGYNDRPDHFAGIAGLAHELPHIEGVEVMPYHPLGESKIERLGIKEAERAAPESPDKATVASWLAQLREAGVPIVNEA